MLNDTIRAAFDIPDALEAWLDRYPKPLNVYGYTVYPDATELEPWCEDDPSWRREWWPLSSSYHPTILFYDTASSKVCMLGGFRDRDDDGFYVDPITVYDSLKDFDKAVEINSLHLNQTGAFLPPDNETYAERLDPEVAAAIQSAMDDLNGPSILPFFFGTLSDFDPLADPGRYETGAW